MRAHKPTAHVDLILQGEQILTSLQQLDPVTYRAIVSVPLELWCPAFLHPEAHTHGVWTNNAAEILGGMLLPARKQLTCAGSLLATLIFLRRRHLEVRSGIPTDGVGHPAVPPRVMTELHRVNELSKNKATKAESLPDGSVLAEATPGVAVTSKTKGKLHLRKHDQLARAWEFISGDATTKKTYTVRLFLLNNGDYRRVCSCNAVGQKQLLCDHCYVVLGAANLLDAFSIYLKPWSTVKSWRKQMGADTLFDGEHALSAFNVLSAMEKLQAEDQVQ